METFLKLFQAYVGGLFREQDVDAVKKWLDPLFEPLVDNAYRAERRDYLLPEPAAPATHSLTPPPSPPARWAAPAPILLGCAADGLNLNGANVRRHGESITRNRPMQLDAAAASPGVSNGLSGRRKQRGMGSRAGRRRDADVLDSSCAQPRSPATAELTGVSGNGRGRGRMI